MSMAQWGRGKRASATTTWGPRLLRLLHITSLGGPARIPRGFGPSTSLFSRTRTRPPTENADHAGPSAFFNYHRSIPLPRPCPSPGSRSPSPCDSAAGGELARAPTSRAPPAARAGSAGACETYPPWRGIPRVPTHGTSQEIQRRTGAGARDASAGGIKFGRARRELRLRSRRPPPESCDAVGCWRLGSARREPERCGGG